MKLSLPGLLALAACAAPAPSGINDPYEGFNRKVHGVNVAVDKNVIRPLATGASKVVPDPVARGVTNFADNLALPGMVVNSVLQANIGDAAHNTMRFLVNTTVGIGGLFDLATPAGAPERSTDFGETLHVWGMAEGPYTELPLLGPSTARDALGKVVDVALDPLRMVIPKDQAWVGTAAKGLALLDKRGRYSETVDSVLYDSADGYAQARLLYLQNRRYDLGQAEAESDFEDPYAQ
ncbi:VacJ family lipoprotein [Rhodobacter sp. KR11]|uniref:MlaA family lipoprotein n=1 Tax=Rhodobacter sp. KR11 TaxID=2974588 RepID=UPI00222382C3|nr:VacJ family lipoprotein [Rhodobacter sp. KR11]MCW1918370.1 VacJ family lipoprotein [Rhodobacter sp. KR11]